MRSGNSFMAFLAGVALTLIAVNIFDSKDSKPAPVVEEQVVEKKSVLDMGDNTELVMFDEPGDVIKVKSLRISEVYPNGAAMAISYDIDNVGLSVLLLPEEGVSYYDDMKIEIKQGQGLVQIGLFKYDLDIGNGRVAPVGKIMK